MRGSSVVPALLVAILCSSLGDVAISLGMKAWSLEYIGLGLALHAGFLGLYLFALGRAELSFVLPFTALDYVLVTLFAVLWGGEDVGLTRWLGAALVTTGVALVVQSE